MSRYRVSLIPKLFSYWWENLDRPHILLDQRFAMRWHLNRFFGPSIFDSRFEKLLAEDFHRPWSEFLREYENGWSIVKNDKDKFHVSLDVQQFKPDEINIKMIDNFVVIEGKKIRYIRYEISILAIKISSFLISLKSDFVIREGLRHP